MRRFLWLGILLLSATCWAQFTLVTGTITDPNGLVYANGTISATLVSSASPKFTSTNLPYTPPTQPVGLNLAGSFTMQLADNTQLTPGGSTWTFTVNCGSGCVPVAGGKGSVSFSVTGITISGASQSITATLTTAALALSNIAGGITGSLPTGGNPGPIPYVSAANTLSEDATNFCWDATNHRLGIVNCAPGFALDLTAATGTVITQFIEVKNNTNGGGAIIEIAASGSSAMDLGVEESGSGGHIVSGSLAKEAVVSNSNANALCIATSNTCRAHFQSGGELDIGTSTAAGSAILLNTNGDAKQIHLYGGGTAPAISSGAGTGPTIGGSDTQGFVTTGTAPGNSIVINLGQNFQNSNNGCGAQDTGSSPVYVQCIVGTSTITLNGIAFSTGAAANFTASHTITWWIGGH